MKYLSLAISFGLVLSAPLVHAGTLNFDGNICSASNTGGGASIACANYAYLNQSYGDTATVDVTYLDLINVGNSLRFWDTGYNNLANVAWGGNGDGNGQSWNSIRIAPLAGQTITLNSFDIGAYPSTQRPSTIIVYDLLGNVLANYGSVNIGVGNVANQFAPNVSSASGIAITWRDSGYNDGIDNIQYTEGVSAVPEPGSLLLLGTGALGLLGELRRRFRA